MDRDADLDYQRSENVLATALNHITNWHSFWDPVILMNPLRPLVQKYYGNVMETYIRKELDKNFAKLKQERLENKKSQKITRTKSVITLAIESYLEENENADLLQMEKLEESFAKYASYQIRLFLFAGTDTTSASIVYVYHLLSKHPEALAKVRKEHDEVFGTDPSCAASLLKQQPALINQCPYTLAIIKETLRLYSPASTMRAGRPGISLHDLHGREYPMDNIGTTIIHQAIHSNPRLWPDPEKFIPERFMVKPDHQLYPNPAAFRPFEQGLRNCIGQTLVFNEMRIVLVLTVREFVIRDAYGEWDALKEKEMGWFGRIKRSVVGESVRTVNGERAYQTEKAGTHPADGYPCTVEMVGGS